MNTPEVTALEAQLDVVGGLLSSLEPDEWERPTRCPPMRVLELTAHLGRVLHRLAEELRVARDDAVNCDRYRYWDPDPTRGERVLRESLEQAEGHDAASMQVWFMRGCVVAIEAARATDPAKPCRRGDSILTAVELCATRVLEAGVHGMDLGHAAMRGELIHPLARGLVVDVLRTRLGTALPPSIGWDEKGFILSGTGRRRLEPNERVTLGALAERFPLVS